MFVFEFRYLAIEWEEVTVVFNQRKIYIAGSTYVSLLNWYRHAYSLSYRCQYPSNFSVCRFQYLS